jgi:hypothetical protein
MTPTEEAEFIALEMRHDIGEKFKDVVNLAFHEFFERRQYLSDDASWGRKRLAAIGCKRMSLPCTGKDCMAAHARPPSLTTGGPAMISANRQNRPL